MIKRFEVRVIDNAYIVTWIEEGDNREDAHKERTVLSKLDLEELLQDLTRRLRTI